VVEPEQRVKGSIFDFTHVSVSATKDVHLVMDRLNTIHAILSRVDAVALSVVRESVIGGNTCKNIVAAITESELVILESRLEGLGHRLGLCIFGGWVADGLGPRFPLMMAGV